MTQGGNLPAQRLFQKQGGVSKSVGLWFHKWYDRSSDLPAGWLTPAEADELRRLAAGRTVLELGAWKGRSTVVLAEVASYVVSVDRHRGIPGHGESLDEYLANVRDLANVAVVIAGFADIVPHLARLRDGLHRRQPRRGIRPRRYRTSRTALAGSDRLPRLGLRGGTGGGDRGAGSRAGHGSSDRSRPMLRKLLICPWFGPLPGMVGQLPHRSRANSTSRATTACF